jgi:outer membrane immunogenic protein
MQRVAIIAAGLVSIAGVTTANAADLPARAPYKAPPPIVAPIYNWGGFYVGINGGGASSHNCYTITNVNNVAVNPTSEGCHDSTGGLAGGQVGYRWQMAQWVFGVEAQGDWANLSGSNGSLTAIIPYTNRTKIDAIGLFTGQVGFAFNNVLLYVKGGGAVTDVKYDSFFTGNGVPIYTASETRWGGAVGAGVEFGFAPGWSVGLEYDHLFMDSRSVVFTPILAVNRTDTIKQDVDMGTVRINYTFGGPVVARY